MSYEFDNLDKKMQPGVDDIIDEYLHDHKKV